MILNRAGIEQLIDRYKKTYIDNPSVMISGYTQENQIVADYNGRQILELMQNADDAGSDIIHIEIDTEKQILCISNKGEAFDLDGIESLMFPGISTKNKTEYIGNKGLGFRSILNWVESVKILTKEVSVSFSRKYVEEFFNQNLSDLPPIIDRVEQERQKNKIAGDTLPIATLAFPKIEDEVASEPYVTQIKLAYKKQEEEAIEKQLASIAEETLLFLPHSRQVILVKNGEQILDLNKTTEANGSIRVGNKLWKVHSERMLSYSDKVKFNYTIAWQDDLSDRGKFYNYFPTDVEAALPCLIHATFDLTNNRKELNKCSENEFILNHIADSISEIIETHFRTEVSDWRAFKFLSPSNANNREFFQPFYRKIIDKRESTYCYPAIDNKYINKNVAIYYGNRFSEWVEQNQLGDAFKYLIKCTEFGIEINRKELQEYNGTEWFEISKIISSRIKSHNQRASLLKLLVTDCQLSLAENQKLPLLIGQDYTFEAGTYHENVFAYRAADQNISLPEFANITFLDNDLYDDLIKIFNQELATNRDGSEDISRTLIRILKPVVNLRQNDSNEVIRYIVSEMRKKDPAPEKVKRFTSFLYSIYKEKKDRRNKLAFDVPLLDRDGRVVDSSKLIFGDDYETEQVTEFVFDGIYRKYHLLGSKELFGFNGVENQELLDFFTWLGVHKYFITKEVTILSPNTDSYFHFLFHEKRVLKPDNARMNNIELKALIVDNIEDLKLLELNKLCILLEKSAILKRAVNFTDEADLNDLVYKYGNAYPKPIKTNYTYIYFQISQLIDFTKYTLSEDSEFELMFKKLDLGSGIFKSCLNKNEVESLKLTLRHLGVSESLEDITVERLKEVLDDQENNFPEGKNSQNFYKKCLEYYLEQRNSYGKDIRIDYCDRFFGRKGIGGDHLELVNKERLYYSDNYLLPRKILSKFYFINLPKRVGEDNVKDIFGVKLIKDELDNIDITMQDTHHLAKEFKKYIESLKAFILAYRIEVIKEKKSRQNEANLIKRLNIELVSELSLKFNNEIITLELNEFIPFKDTIYIKAGYKNYVTELLTVPEFCDAIAEVFCITFKISSLKNTFRRIIKDGSSETLHILKTDEKEQFLREARELLGVNPFELEFWKKLFPNEDFEGVYSDHFVSQLERILGNSLPDQYKSVDFANIATKPGIQFLQWILKVTGKELYQIIQPKDLEAWHKVNIDNTVRDHLQEFRWLLWQKANSGNVEIKKQFHSDYLSFNNASDTDYFRAFLEKNKFELYPDYKRALIVFAKSQFEVDLQSIKVTDSDIENKYTVLMQSYSIGIDLEDSEKIIKEDHPDLFSLIYFDGFEVEIKRVLEEYKNKRVNDFDTSEDNEAEEESTIIITRSNILAASPRALNPSKGDADYAHTSQTSRKKTLAGKKEENKVIKALRSDGYEVIPVSKFTDSKHYDLEYKKPDGEWRYLEVKKDSGGYFFMSKAEKNTAMNNANAGKYDLAIVNGSNIHIIESPFNFINESFEKNTKFYAEPSDYIIHFKVDNNVDE